MANQIFSILLFHKEDNKISIVVFTDFYCDDCEWMEMQLNYNQTSRFFYFFWLIDGFN